MYFNYICAQNKTNLIMKNNFFIGLSLLFAVVLSLNSCKKYEEGPGFSLRSKTARLTGDWKATSITVDGEEILVISEETFEGTSTSRMEVTNTIKKNGEYTMLIERTISLTYNGQVLYEETTNESDSGEWEWIDSKEKIKFKSNDDLEVTEMTVLRLTNKELILENIDDGDVVRMEFEKK